jgi:hypothetical protein
MAFSTCKKIALAPLPAMTGINYWFKYFFPLSNPSNEKDFT